MSRHPRVFFAMALLSASLFTGQAFADRTLTDQLGREVTLPDHITRAVVLQHQTLNLLVQLNAADDVVGVLSSWKNSLARSLRALCRTLKNCRCQAISPGQYREPAGATSAGSLRCQPCAAGDDPADPERRSRWWRSLRQDAAGEKNKMNPTMANEEQAYNEGLKQGSA